MESLIIHPSRYGKFFWRAGGDGGRGLAPAGAKRASSACASYPDSVADSAAKIYTPEERFWEHCLLRFEYAYVGLPGLDAEPFVTGEHLLGVALSALMRTPPERRAELYAEALKRIARAGDNDWRCFLLAECVEAYGSLDEAQRQQLQALLNSEQYQEVRPFMITTYERGKIEGRIEGRIQGQIQERRETALLQLEAKSPEVKHRVEVLTPEQLRQILLDLVKAQSLEELHLEA
jgi:hypothetical protein